MSRASLRVVAQVLAVILAAGLSLSCETLDGASRRDSGSKAAAGGTKMERLSYSFPQVFKEVNDNDLVGLKAAISNGAGVNQTFTIPLGAYSSTFTPLIMAAALGRVEAAQILLDAGADINATDVAAPVSNKRPDPRYTALHYAVGYPELVKLLLAKGANPGKRGSDGNTPLHCAAGAEPSRPLMGHGLNGSDADRAQTIRLLVAAGAKVDSQAYPDDVSFIKVKLPAGAPKDTKVSQPSFGTGQTSLTYAAAEGLTACAIALIECGAKVDGLMVDPYTKERADIPLLAAVGGNHLETVTALLDRKANIHLAEPVGTCAILVASQGLMMPMAKLLVSRGADVNQAYSLSGQTPLMLATNQGGLDKESFSAGEKLGIGLLGYNFKSDDAKQAASLEMMKFLVDSGADVNAQGPTKWTALMWASGLGVSPRSTEKAAYLLSKGAKVNLQDKDGKTALYHATRKAYINIAQLLLKAGADPNLASATGRTPLMEAAGALPDYELKNQDYPAMVELLLKSGASVNAKDAYNMTALAYARRYGGQRSQELLRNAGGIVDPAQKTDPAERQIVGVWTGDSNFFRYTWEFRADGSWSYRVAYNEAVFKQQNITDQGQKDAANKSLQDQADMQGSKGSYSFRDEALILANKGAAVPYQVLGWYISGKELHLNGQQWVCTRK